MLKKRQKWVALLVTLAFVWMLRVSTMPLAAAGTTEQVGSANVEPGPNYVEKAGHASAPAKSKSILPLVLIGVGVVAVAAVLILVVFKTKYDILGTWAVSWQWTSGSPNSDTGTFTFSGTKESGTVSDSYGDTGTFTVDGKKVTWVLSSYDPNFTWTGQFDSKDAMSGTVVLASEGHSGIWTATRTSTTASLPRPAAAQAAKSPWSKNRQE